MARVSLTDDVLGDSDDQKEAAPARPTTTRRRTRAAKPAAETTPQQREPKPIRITVDLPVGQHSALLQWCLDAAPQLGRGRVPGQQVMRALVARLLTDERLSRQIIADLADGRRDT